MSLKIIIIKSERLQRRNPDSMDEGGLNSEKKEGSDGQMPLRA